MLFVPCHVFVVVSSRLVWERRAAIIDVDGCRENTQVDKVEQLNITGSLESFTIDIMDENYLTVWTKSFYQIGPWAASVQ